MCRDIDKVAAHSRWPLTTVVALGRYYCTRWCDNLQCRTLHHQQPVQQSCQCCPQMAGYICQEWRHLESLSCRVSHRSVNNRTFESYWSIVKTIVHLLWGNFLNRMPMFQPTSTALDHAETGLSFGIRFQISIESKLSLYYHFDPWSHEQYIFHNIARHYCDVYELFMWCDVGTSTNNRNHGCKLTQQCQWLDTSAIHFTTRLLWKYCPVSR